MDTIHSLVLEVLRRKLVGRRVRLIRTSDPWTALSAGDEGIVTLIDDMATVHVSWDNGASLGLIADEDKWIVLPEATS